MKYLLRAIAWLFKFAWFLVCTVLYYAFISIMFSASFLWDFDFKKASKSFKICFRATKIGSEPDGTLKDVYRTPYDLFINRPVRLEDKEFYSFF